MFCSKDCPKDRPHQAPFEQPLYLPHVAFLKKSHSLQYTFATMADLSTKPDAEKLNAINDTHGTNIDTVAEEKLLRKCDIRSLPPLFVLLLLTFLDRSNIGKSSHLGQRIVELTGN